MKISNETKIGALAVVTITMLILGYNYMKGNNLFSKDNTYYARYDRLDGLMVASLVKINGLTIGRVMDLELIPDSSKDILATISISGKIKIPKNSIARIVSSDLLGSKAIEFEFTNSTDYYKPGDTLVADIKEDLSTQVSNEILPVKLKAESLLTSMDSILTTIKIIFNENTQDDIKKSVNSIKNTLVNLDHSSGTLDTLLKNNVSRLNRIFDNVEAITTNLKNSEKEITNIVSNFSAVSDSLKMSKITSIVNNANATLASVDSVLTKINDGEGSLGLLINDDKLYYNLNNSSAQLDLLLQDLRLHPEKYVHFSLVHKVVKDENK